MIQYPKARDLQSAIHVGTWGNSNIPVYDVPSMHSLNQLVGYIKHINAGNGTVLYRGQCKLYEHVVPSIKHIPEKESAYKESLVNAVEAIIGDDACSKFFGLRNTDVNGWGLYQKLVVEAVLQHYGAKTYCVDFVDNHWTALWFGLYEWDNTNRRYLLRDNSGNGEKDSHIILGDKMKRRVYPDEPTLESIILDELCIDAIERCAEKAPLSSEELIRRRKERVLRSNHQSWEAKCETIKKYNNRIDAIEATDHLFLFLYVADTNVSNFRGVYFGKDSYTIDLRKALPSTFLRPCSQHGWIVRGKSNSYVFDTNISCIIRVSVDLAKEMLGTGSLLSQENFFPDETIDQGYKILLERQEASRLKSKYCKLLAAEMITDFGAK